MGNIESNEYFEFTDAKWKPIDEREGEFDLENHLTRYYYFWRILESTLGIKNVFTFSTAKSSAFAVIGQGV